MNGGWMVKGGENEGTNVCALYPRGDIGHNLLNRKRLGITCGAQWAGHTVDRWYSSRKWMLFWQIEGLPPREDHLRLVNNEWLAINQQYHKWNIWEPTTQGETCRFLWQWVATGSNSFMIWMPLSWPCRCKSFYSVYTQKYSTRSTSLTYIQSL